MQLAYRKLLPAFLDLVILKIYLAFAVIEVSSKSSIVSSPRARIYFSLLSAYTDKLFFTSQITTMLPNSLMDNENCESAQNPTE